jgi:hypothetical protein
MIKMTPNDFKTLYALKNHIYQAYLNPLSWFIKKSIHTTPHTIHWPIPFCLQKRPNSVYQIRALDYSIAFSFAPTCLTKRSQKQNLTYTQIFQISKKQYHQLAHHANQINMSVKLV